MNSFRWIYQFIQCNMIYSILVSNIFPHSVPSTKEKSGLKYWSIKAVIYSNPLLLGSVSKRTQAFSSSVCHQKINGNKHSRSFTQHNCTFHISYNCLLPWQLVRLGHLQFLLIFSFLFLFPKLWIYHRTINYHILNLERWKLLEVLFTVADEWHSPSLPVAAKFLLSFVINPSIIFRMFSQSTFVVIIQRSVNPL